MKGNKRAFVVYCVLLIGACLIGYCDFKYLGNYCFNLTDRWGFWYFVQTFFIFFVEAIIVFGMVCVIDNSWLVPIKKLFKK